MLSFSKILLKSLFRKPATVAYPKAPLIPVQALRGHMLVDIEECIFCGMCQRKCPTGAIIVSKTDRSWTIARFQCIQCNCCAEVCPKKCLHMKEELTPADVVKTSDTTALSPMPEPSRDA